MEQIKNYLEIVRGLVYRRINVSPKSEKQIVKSFHQLYYNAAVWKKTWQNTYWFGTKILKCPLDCWIYQELIYKIKPDVIIETGTYNGGSAYFMAGLMDLMNKGKIITIDVESFKGKPKHKRIKYLLGMSTSKNILDTIKKMVKPKDKVLVILDSDHSYGNVKEELKIYDKFVSKGSYLIVEDTNINGNPVRKESGPGPMEAVLEFMKNNKSFKIDKEQEKFYLTFNPNGYLRRIK